MSPRRDHDTEWILGRHPVAEALRTGRRIDRVLIADGTRGLGEITGLARGRHVLVQVVPRPRLDQLARGQRHQGVAASSAAYEYVDLDDVIASLSDRSEPGLVVVVDELQDPHNLGSILRTADAAGVDAVVIGKHRAVGLTAAVARASAGAIEHVPVARVTNVVQSLQRLKEAGFWIVGADADGDRLVTEVTYDVPIALVVGGEDKGLGRLVSETCDFRVRLPMRGHLNSLNASVAAALCIYEIFRQRSAKAGS